MDFKTCLVSFSLNRDTNEVEIRYSRKLILTFDTNGLTRVKVMKIIVIQRIWFFKNVARVLINPDYAVPNPFMEVY